MRRHPPGAQSAYIAVIILAGAVSAAGLIPRICPGGLEQVEALRIDTVRVALVELLFTFALMWVILNVAIAKGTADNGFYGIAIGAIVGAGAYAVGPISLAAFNPAVTLALCINGFLPRSALPLYTLVQCLAAVAAGLLFRSMRITNPAELPGDCASGAQE